MVNPAPVRVPRKSTLSSPLVKAANKIVTSPTFAKARSIDFDKKNEYDKFIKFIESSNQELLRVKLPKKNDISKDGYGDSKGGGGRRGGLLSNLLKLLGLKTGTSILSKLLSNIRKSLMKSKYTPKFIKKALAGLKRWWRNITKPFRQTRRFITSLPGKIRAWTAKNFKKSMTFIKKNFDEAILGIKNLKNAKWVKALVQRAGKLKNFADDAVKVGKEVITNSKVVKASSNIIKKIGPKVGPKLASLTAGEITVIGGIVADLGMAAYRFKKGDVTGGVLSTLSAIPILGIPVAAVDIARDFNVFDDDSTILGKIDFLNVLKSKKQKDKEREEKLDVKPLEEALQEENGAFSHLSNQEKENRLRENMLIKQIEEQQKNDTDPLMDSNYENQIQEVLRLSDKELKEQTDKLLLMPENKETKQLIEKLNPESVGQSSMTTVIDNRQTFLVPFDSGAQENSSGGSSGGFNFNVKPSIIVMNPNSLMMDELLQLKLDKE